MTVSNFVNQLNYYKRNDTKQSWKRELMTFFSNDYVDLLRVDSSNVAGGSVVKRGKQWSLIVNCKKSFLSLPKWHELKKQLGSDLKYTAVTRGELKGNYGIRLYQMSNDPTEEIVQAFFECLFS